ncbi:alpha/beta fold hydrolase [Herbidospora cretacea]|uniref:alpha/beta fold hydrolase n=1 Tax=Herbidospora cretacea TaxID=28444 RepID=UPI0007C7D67C|nr:alpha/beta fold hydrolase [Herbidospora cretacea]
MDVVPLAWKEAGRPGGVPVVLIHGLTGSSATWDRIAPALGRRRWIAPDMRGHGASPRHADYSLELMAADTLAFLDARGLTEIDLVGHSMGGRVAALVARDRPGLVRRLVLEDSFPAAREPQAFEPYVVTGDEDFDPVVVDVIRADVRRVDPAWWARLPELTMPVLVVGGAYSELVPQEALARLTSALPDGRRVVLGAGHNVHGEDPEGFVKEVAAFLR